MHMNLDMYKYLNYVYKPKDDNVCRYTNAQCHNNQIITGQFIHPLVSELYRIFERYQLHSVLVRTFCRDIQN